MTANDGSNTASTCCGLLRTMTCGNRRKQTKTNTSIDARKNQMPCSVRPTPSTCASRTATITVTTPSSTRAGKNSAGGSSRKVLSKSRDPELLSASMRSENRIRALNAARMVPR
jgi:hypothetical protein